MIKSMPSIDAGKPGLWVSQSLGSRLAPSARPATVSLPGFRVGSLVRVIDDEDIAPGTSLNDKLGIVIEVINNVTYDYRILIGEDRYYVFEQEIEEVPT